MRETKEVLNQETGEYEKMIVKTKVGKILRDIALVAMSVLEFLRLMKGF